MFNASETRLKIAAVLLSAGMLAASAWAAWIPLAPRATAHTAQAQPAAREPKKIAPLAAVQVVTQPPPPPVEPPAAVVEPEQPQQPVLAPSMTMPFDLPQLLTAARQPAVEHAARGLAWTVHIAAQPGSTAAPDSGNNAVEAIPNDEPAPTANDQVVLVNPAASGGPIHFLVGRKTHTLQPGERRAWQPEELGVLQFHRGGEFGKARLELPPGTYKFYIGEQGWDLTPAGE